MPQIVELRQNRDYIEPDFPGYKLSLQIIPHFALKLNSKVHLVNPSNEQYTYKHAKLFTLHNHILALETDPLEGLEIAYYVGHDMFIYKMKLDLRGLEEICTNWKIPQINPQKTYNVTMCIVNEQLIIVADGSGSLYLLDQSTAEWKCVFNDTLQFPFIILDCKLSENDILHVLLFNIIASDTLNQMDQPERKHKSSIHWAKFECIDSVWKQKSLQEMDSLSELHFSMFGSRAEELYILSTEGGFIKEEAEEKSEIMFTWCQDEESVSIYIQGTNVEVSNDQCITVSNHKGVILEGKLSGEVDPSLTTWILDKSNGTLEISLSKISKANWPCLIDGKKLLGEYLPNEKSAKEAHEKLKHLCAEHTVEAIPTKTSTLTDQVEECDFVSSKGALIERLTPDLRISHRVFLTQEVIFAERDCFAIQQNEDICLYRPLQEESIWKLEHFGTLFAMGYIRASKQRRKFTTCAPDLSYSIVAESKRHIFIYRQNVDVTSGELRHRTTGKRIRQLAQQQVIELEKDDDVLGVRATNNALFVLTEEKMYAFKMK